MPGSARGADRHAVPAGRPRRSHLRPAARRDHPRLLRPAEVAQPRLCVSRLRDHGLPRREARQARHPGRRAARGRAGDDRPPRQGRLAGAQAYRAPAQAHPETALRGPHPGGDRRQDHRPRDRLGDAQGRPRQVLRRRHHPQAQAARETEGGQEADEAGGQRRDPPGGLHGRAQAGRIGMATKKRRRPAKSKTAPVVVEAAVEAAAPATTTVARPRGRPATPLIDARDVPWTSRGLLALLGLAFALQIPIGLILHLTSHTNPLIIDVFFFQPQFLVIAGVVVMPLARRLTGQPRNLRLLESLSLGVMYALLALMVGTVFVHPATAAQSVNSAQWLSNLKVSDGLLLAMSDVVALFGTVTLYPGFSRMLGAPGRRARARMLQRTGSASAGRKPTGRS